MVRMRRKNVPAISILLLQLFIWRSKQDEDGVHDDARKERSHSEEFWSSFAINPVYRVPIPSGHVYFTEPFQTKEGFLKRWTMSRVGAETAATPASKYEGLWRVEEMKRNSLRGDLGLVLKRSSMYHAISVPLDKPFEFGNKPLIVQYEVKFQAGQDCGGAYIKLLTKDDKLDLSNFSGMTPYTIMFGPDKCGKDEKEKHVRPPFVEFGEIFTDNKIHLFTLGVYPNNSFEIYLDQTRINFGSLLKDVVDESMGEKWETALTGFSKSLPADGLGLWSQPMVHNPKYKTQLMSSVSSNPSFQGNWFSKLIPNPDYFDDQEPFRMPPISALGLELWSTSSNIFFDNFIVTDDKQVADQWADHGWKPKKIIEVANSKGLRGLMVYLYDTGLERRWLWGIYAFFFLLPFILVSVFFCPESGPLFKASMIANAVRPGEEEEEAAETKRNEKKERVRRKQSKKKEEQSADQVKDKNMADEKVDDDEAVNERKDIDGSESSENETNHQTRLKIRRRKTKKST